MMSFSRQALSLYLLYFSIYVTKRIHPINNLKKAMVWIKTEEYNKKNKTNINKMIVVWRHDRRNRTPDGDTEEVTEIETERRTKETETAINSLVSKQEKWWKGDRHGGKETETEIETYTYTTALNETIINFQREATTLEYETSGVASFLHLFQFISGDD